MRQCGRIWEVSRLTGDVDFMIHGIFSYELFGHTVWITTSHVCIFIVMLSLLIFAIVANRSLAHGENVPTGFQNVVELVVEKLDGMVEGTMGKEVGAGFANYIGTVFLFVLLSNIAGLFGLRPPTADYGTTLALALITFFFDPHYKNKEPERRIYLERTLFPAAAMAATLDSDQCDQYDRRTDFAVASSVRQCIVGNGHVSVSLWAAWQAGIYLAGGASYLF